MPSAATLGITYDGRAFD